MVSELLGKFFLVVGLMSQILRLMGITTCFIMGMALAILAGSTRKNTNAKLMSKYYILISFTKNFVLLDNFLNFDKSFSIMPSNFFIRDNNSYV